MLAVFGSATIMLVGSSPETSFGGSLKLLGVSDAFLLTAPCRRGAASDFCINKLHGKGYLPPLPKQVTKTFQVAVDGVPIDLCLSASFRHTVLTASLNRYFDDRFFARVDFAWGPILVVRRLSSRDWNLTFQKSLGARTRSESVSQ